MAVLISGIAEMMKNPGGLWEILILKVFDFIGNYGWRIFFFTVCLKLVLLPLDLFQRFKMRKNQLITERIKPQMEKLQQQYAGDKQALAQKQMELNKREGFSYFSSCLPMIVTLVVFFYLFAGLNNISRFKNLKEYVELYDAYVAVETVEKDKEFTVTVGDGENAQQRTVSWNVLKAEQDTLLATRPKDTDYKDENGNWKEGGEAQFNLDTDNWNAAYGNQSAALQRAMERLYADNIRSVAQKAVEEKYGEIRESFLWVRNIWSPDVPWKKAILSYDGFITNISDYKKYDKASKKLGLTIGQDMFDTMISEGTYNNVTGSLRSSDYNRANGFLILPLLSVGLSFLSQFITSRLQKQSGQASPEGGMASSMKMMMIIMPLMMGMFALSYTAMFTLYIVVNSLTTILINVVTTLAMNGKSKNREKKLTTGVQKYGRPDPKDL